MRSRQACRRRNGASDVISEDLAKHVQTYGHVKSLGGALATRSRVGLGWISDGYRTPRYDYRQITSRKWKSTTTTYLVRICSVLYTMNLPSKLVSKSENKY